MLNCCFAVQFSLSLTLAVLIFITAVFCLLQIANVFYVNSYTPNSSVGTEKKHSQKTDDNSGGVCIR